MASNKHGDFNVERSLNQEHGDVAQHGAYLKKTNTYFDYISYIKFYLPKDSKMGAVPHLIWHHALDQRLALHRQVVLFDCDAFTQKFYKAKWLDCQNGQSSGGFDLWNPEGNLLSPCCFYNTSEKYLSFSVVDVLTSCYNSWFF